MMTTTMLMDNNKYDGVADENGADDDDDDDGDGDIKHSGDER